jgi:hypothetical protein
MCKTLVSNSSTTKGKKKKKNRYLETENKIVVMGEIVRCNYASK